MARKKDAQQTPADPPPNDDRQAFERALDDSLGRDRGDLRPLARDRRRVREELPAPAATPRPGIAPAGNAGRPSVPRPLRAIQPAGAGGFSYLADGEPLARARELRGHRQVDATLDLHGQRGADVDAALERFLAGARARGQRLLLVIHGRGQRSGPEGPVLRQRVVAALTAGPLSADVLAVVSAPAALGGEGAALVWLRRRR